MLRASDFFGADDTDGVDKFQTIARRALHDQKVEDALTQAARENETLRTSNRELQLQVETLTASMAANIDDRERVLAFKSKRVEELTAQVKQLESVNASLVETLQGGGRGGGGEDVVRPLFHALETCRELEFQRLLAEATAQVERLQHTIAEDASLVREMRGVAAEKQAMDATLRALQDQLRELRASKDEQIHFLERKLVFEQDRLTREKAQAIHAHEEEMDTRLATQLDVTTQRTISENARVQLELRYQSAALEKLVAQNDTLTEQLRHARQQQRVGEDMHLALSRKMRFYEQVVAKIQLQDKDKQQQQQQQQFNLESDRNGMQERRRKRKPPLPSLAPTQSAFALNGEVEGGNDATESTAQLTLDMSALELEGDSLNTATRALDSHLLRRELTRKEVAACIQVHHAALSPSSSYASASSSSSPLPRRRPLRGGRPHAAMLPKSEYLPASYHSRHGPRSLRNAPLTLEAFLQDLVGPSVPARPPGALSRSNNNDSEPVTEPLPTLPVTARSDGSELWRTPASRDPNSAPATARV